MSAVWLSCHYLESKSSSLVDDGTTSFSFTEVNIMKTARLSLYPRLLLFCFACPLSAQQAKKKTPAAKAIPLAESIPENRSTKHTLQVDGKTMEYTATAGQMPIKNTNGEVEAYIFYTAYTLDKKNAATRPLT